MKQRSGFWQRESSMFARENFSILKSVISIFFLFLFLFATSVGTIMYCFQETANATFSVLENFSGEEKESDKEESKDKTEESAISDSTHLFGSEYLMSLSLAFACHRWCAARPGYSKGVYSPPELS